MPEVVCHAGMLVGSEDILLEYEPHSGPPRFSSPGRNRKIRACSGMFHRAMRLSEAGALLPVCKIPARFFVASLPQRNVDSFTLQLQITRNIHEDD